MILPFKKLKHLMLCCRSGNALIEFTITLPILLIMLIGTVETGRYFIINQKLDKVASSMADFATQGTTVSTSDLDTYASAIEEIFQPYTFNGTVIWSSVAFFNNPTAPCQGTNVDCVSWQYSQLGNDTSNVGAVGGNATIPGNYTVVQGQNVIVAEVFYNYTPMLAATAYILPGFTAGQLYKTAVYKPRQGTLTTLNP